MVRNVGRDKGGAGAGESNTSPNTVYLITPPTALIAAINPLSGALPLPSTPTAAINYPI